jgi:hypothetical protein
MANDHAVNDIAAIGNFTFGFYPGDEILGSRYSSLEPIKMVAVVIFPGSYPLQRMR